MHDRSITLRSNGEWPNILASRHFPLEKMSPSMITTMMTIMRTLPSLARRERDWGAVRCVFIGTFEQRLVTPPPS